MRRGPFDATIARDYCARLAALPLVADFERSRNWVLLVLAPVPSESANQLPELEHRHWNEPNEQTQQAVRHRQLSNVEKGSRDRHVVNRQLHQHGYDDHRDETQIAEGPHLPEQLRPTP